MATKLVSLRLAPTILCRSTAQPAQLSQRSWQTQWLRYRPFSSTSLILEKKYTRDHEWIDVPSGSKTATLGISTYAAEQLGDVIYVELPAVDTEFGNGDAIGAVESVKSASDIMTPVSGKVVEVNNSLEEKPKLLNESPEQDGWIAKIEVADQSELEGLMSADDYKAFTDEEGA